MAGRKEEEGRGRGKGEGEECGGVLRSIISTIITAARLLGRRGKWTPCETGDREPGRQALACVRQTKAKRARRAGGGGREGGRVDAQTEEGRKEGRQGREGKGRKEGRGGGEGGGSLRVPSENGLQHLADAVVSRLDRFRFPAQEDL